MTRASGARRLTPPVHGLQRGIMHDSSDVDCAKMALSTFLGAEKGILPRAHVLFMKGK